MSDTHTNAVRILRAACKRSPGVRGFGAGLFAVKQYSGDGFRIRWLLDHHDIGRSHARYYLCGLFAPTEEELAADEMVFFSAGLQQGRDKANAEWSKRHMRYSDGIASALEGHRLLRETGEPARSDREEIALLVRNNAELRAKLRRLEEWCRMEAIAMDGGFKFVSGSELLDKLCEMGVKP